MVHTGRHTIDSASAGEETVNVHPSISDVCMVIIAVFVVLAYFNGWG